MIQNDFCSYMKMEEHFNGLILFDIMRQNLLNKPELVSSNSVQFRREVWLVE